MNVVAITATVNKSNLWPFFQFKKRKYYVSVTSFYMSVEPVRDITSRSVKFSPKFPHFHSPSVMKLGLLISFFIAERLVDDQALLVTGYSVNHFGDASSRVL